MLCSTPKPRAAADGVPCSEPQEEVLDSPTQDTQVAEEEECKEEGQACEIYEDSLSNCCNGRHTCFASGCYYTEP